MIADNGNESIADAFPWGQVTPADIDGFALEELKVILASAVECIKEKDASKLTVELLALKQMN